ncbi:hypothetical protein [Photobacterium leiognathi]|uniref:hypothetical protein n=1 Tax=Photobacterium leiognathi TaxID=553611 RepID=UPI002733042F|nr:hypothetical protein [Photobacterium leiognathi]
MQIHEIYLLSKWYTSNVQSKNPQSFLSQCSNGIKQHIHNKAAANEYITSCKAKMLNFLSNLDITTLTDNQRKCLTHLNLDSLLLEKAPEHFELLLSLANHDTNYVIVTLERYQILYSEASNSFSQCASSLQKIVEPELLAPIDVHEGKVLTRVTFHNDASINNIVEFNKWAKSWSFIARGFSMASGETPESFEIVNTDRGSFIIDLLVGAGAMKLFFEALKSFTDLSISIIDLKMKLKEIDKFKNVVSDDVYEQFINDAKEKLTLEENHIVERVINELNQKGLIKNLEAQNDLSKAIKEIHKFNTHGGSVKCLASNDDTFNHESIEQLNASYKQLQYKSEVKRIEDNKQNI